MQLDSLHVWHLPKTWAPHLGVQDQSEVLFIETCQRYLWISSTERSQSRNLGVELGAKPFKGRDAYLFLLRVAAGLESEVIGETDVFGQVKEAWRKLEFQGNLLSFELGPWIRRLFEDTKEIRTRYLQNLGGGSYGTLVRKLIKDQTSGAELPGPVLMIGAGQIAQSVGPFLTDSELWLWNRDPMRLCSLSQALSNSTRSRVKKLETSEAERSAWRGARHVVVCIPYDAALDPQRVEWFQEGGTENRSVIHLGGPKDPNGVWNSLSRFYSLTDIFDLQKRLGNIRSVQVTQAERACGERAQLRALGGSLSISHGWEDLACFA